METLFIQLPRENEEDIAYLVASAEGGSNTRLMRGRLEDCARLAENKKLVVLAPSENILVSHVALAIRNRTQFAKALPYALEEQLADDVDDLHFAIGSRLEDGTTPVAVVRKALMAEWGEKLSAAGLNPDKMVPDVLSLPPDGKRWNVLIEGNRALARCGPSDGFVCEPDLFGLLIQRAFESAANPPESIRIFESGAAPETSLDLPAALPFERLRRDAVNALSFAAHQSPNAFINLLQGAFRNKRESQGAFRQWKVAAVLLAVWLGLGIGQSAMDYFKLKAHDQALTAAIEQLYRDAFPETQRIQDARKQMEIALRQLRAQARTGSQDDFLNLLAASAKGLGTAKTVTLDNMGYRNGQLDMSLSLANLQTLEKIKSAIDSDLLQAEIASAQTTGDKVNARLRVQGKTP